MSGPAPKPAHLRQRLNKKSGHAMLEARPQDIEIPTIPNPDGRTWHPLTLEWWARVWGSPMANQYLPSDVDGLGRVAVLVDKFNLTGSSAVAAEIRLQEMRFGLSPLDRSRLQWELAKADEAEKRRESIDMRTRDPRKTLKAV
jgi:hypothetical protein